MDQQFVKLLVHHRAGNPAMIHHVTKEIDGLCVRMAELLAASGAHAGLADLLPHIALRIVGAMQEIDVTAREELAQCDNGDSRPQPVTPTPATLEWANKLFSDAEILDGIREIRQTGGGELRNLIQELETPSAP